MIFDASVEKSYILWGCGYYGQAAAVTLGKEHIYSFVDNNSQKWKTKVLGIEVISPDMLRCLSHDYQCIVSLAQPAATVVSRQLSDM